MCYGCYCRIIPPPRRNRPSVICEDGEVARRGRGGKMTKLSVLDYDAVLIDGYGVGGIGREAEPYVLVEAHGAEP